MWGSLVTAVGVVVAMSAFTAGPASETADAHTLELYRTTCQPCHMADGNAALEAMNLANGKWRHGTSVKEIAKVIGDGVPGTAMMPFKTRFTEEEILALAKYVRAFDKTLKPEAEVAKKPPTQTK